MAKLGFGYGSEFQLLRFLGHHREEFNAIVSNELKTRERIEWLDFPYSDSSEYGDSEYVGIDFLKGTPSYASIKKAWAKYWPNPSFAPNWDAIGKAGNEYIIVEAKAHAKELISTSGAKTESFTQINSKMEEAKVTLGINTPNSWMKTYYQKANRILLLHFLAQNGIKARLLFVYFINGYERGDKSIKSKEQWESILKAQDEYLGITGNKWVKENVKNVFVSCK